MRFTLDYYTDFVIRENLNAFQFIDLLEKNNDLDVLVKISRDWLLNWFPKKDSKSIKLVDEVYSEECIKYTFEKLNLYKDLEALSQHSSEEFVDGLISLMKKGELSFQGILDKFLQNRLNQYGRQSDGFELLLNEFILDKKDVERFNAIIENDRWRKKEGVHTIFEFIRHLTVYTQVDYDVFEEKDENDVDYELLKLNNLNEKVYKLNFKFEDNQRNDLGQTLISNEIALNRLTEIVENNLETNYNFESLMSYLKKNEKKNLLNI